MKIKSLVTNTKFLLGLIVFLLIFVIFILFYFLFIHDHGQNNNMIRTETGVLGPDTNDDSVKQHIFSSNFEQTDGELPPAKSKGAINSSNYR